MGAVGSSAKLRSTPERIFEVRPDRQSKIKMSIPTRDGSRLRKASISDNQLPSFINDRGIMMRTKWSLAIHHEDRGEGSLISEDHFVHFADVHATMKRNKGKAFVVRIPKTAKPMEIQAFHNLKKLGYVIDAR
jgi:hypothetical protein